MRTGELFETRNKIILHGNNIPKGTIGVVVRQNSYSSYVVFVDEFFGNFYFPNSEMVSLNVVLKITIELDGDGRQVWNIFNETFYYD